MELCSYSRRFYAKMRAHGWKSMMLVGLLVASIFLMVTYGGNRGLNQRQIAHVSQSSDEVISNLLGKKLKNYEVMDAETGKSNIYKILRIPPTTPRQPRYTGPTTIRTTTYDSRYPPQKKSGYIPTTPKSNSVNTYQNGVPQQNQQMLQPVLQQQIMPNDLVSHQFQQQQQKIMQLEEQLRQHQLWQQQHQVGNNPLNNQQVNQPQQNSQGGEQQQQQPTLVQQQSNQQPQTQPMQQQSNLQPQTQPMQKQVNQQPQTQPMQQPMVQQQGALPQQGSGQPPQQMESQQQGPIIQQGSGQQGQSQQQVGEQPQIPVAKPSQIQGNSEKQLASQVHGQVHQQVTSRIPQIINQPQHPVTASFASQPLNQQRVTSKSPQEGNRRLEQVTQGVPQNVNKEKVTPRFPEQQQKDIQNQLQKLNQQSQQAVGKQGQQQQSSGQLKQLEIQ